jgi:hypothetical protein
MEGGAATMDGSVGSVPVDPTVALTTIGTGGLPREHGVVGPVFRNNLGYARTEGSSLQEVPVGGLVEAWGRTSPGSSIATLADDLDREFNDDAMIGLIATDPSDRGLIGRNWYPGSDRDDVVVASGDVPVQTRAFTEMLDRGRFGRDHIPDLIAVAAEGTIEELDVQLRTLERAATAAAQGSVVIAVAGTGATPSNESDPGSARGFVRAVEKEIPGPGTVVSAAVPAGLFLDQQAMIKKGIRSADVVRAATGIRAPDGSRMTADVFGGLAVSFGRYC